VGRCGGSRSKLAPSVVLRFQHFDQLSACSLFQAWEDGSLILAVVAEIDEDHERIPESR
jgi:hypothetical protein